METLNEYRERVIRISDERKEFVTDVDGFVYWWPEGSPNGHLDSHHLRWLADEIDRRNEKWQRNIDWSALLALRNQGDRRCRVRYTTIPDRRHVHCRRIKQDWNRMKYVYISEHGERIFSISRTVRKKS